VLVGAVRLWRLRSRSSERMLGTVTEVGTLMPHVGAVPPPGIAASQCCVCAASGDALAVRASPTPSDSNIAFM
jgi:hypothetical protein